MEGQICNILYLKRQIFKTPKKENYNLLHIFEEILLLPSPNDSDISLMKSHLYIIIFHDWSCHGFAELKCAQTYKLYVHSIRSDK